jgi:hypothetical protein
LPSCAGSFVAPLDCSLRDMFQHPSLRRVKEPDRNGQIWFRIDPARAAEAAAFIVSQLRGTASVILPAPEGDPDRVMVIEAVDGGYRCLHAGHGWSGDWQSIEVDALLALLVSLAPHAAAEDAVYSPSTPRPRNRTGLCEVHAMLPAKDVCPACLRELCEDCFAGGVSSWCRACHEEVEARRRQAKAKLRRMIVVAIGVTGVIWLLRR